MEDKLVSLHIDISLYAILLRVGGDMEKERKKINAASLGTKKILNIRVLDVSWRGRESLCV